MATPEPELPAGRSSALHAISEPKPGLACRLAQLLARPVAEADRRRAMRHLAYWTGASARAAAAELGEPLWQAASLGLPIAAPSDIAHFTFEASLGSLDELDDTHRAALVHPGPVVIPVVRHLARVLGAAGAWDVQGADMADAIVRGYEAAIRVGLAVGPAHYVHWHTTATCGGIGAAAAASAMLGLEVDATAHALSLAATRASGLWQIRLEPCDGKPWHTSQAGQVGLAAAAMARAGLRGPAHAFEGEKGFFAVMCPDGGPDRLLAEPTTAWKIHETSFKPWPACRHAHPSIAAALTLRDQIADQEDKNVAGSTLVAPASSALSGNMTDTIVSLLVETYPDAIAFCNTPSPADRQQARFSLQHAVAAALCWGDPGFDAFEHVARQDPVCAALRARIQVTTAPDITQAYPAHFGARVTVTLSDGSTRVAHAPDAPGDPECPMEDARLDTLIANLLRAGNWSPEAIALQQAAWADPSFSTGATLAAPLRSPRHSY